MLKKDFQEHSETREKIQASLLNLERRRNNTITSFLWDQISYKTSMKPLLYFLMILAFASLISISFIGIYKALVCIFVIYDVNLYVSTKIKAKIGTEIKAMEYLCRIIDLAEVIGRVEDEGIKEYTLKLKEKANICRVITKKMPLLK